MLMCLSQNRRGARWRRGRRRRPRPQAVVRQFRHARGQGWDVRCTVADGAVVHLPPNSFAVGRAVGVEGVKGGVGDTMGAPQS